MLDGGAQGAHFEVVKRGLLRRTMPFAMREIFDDVFKNQPLDPTEAARLAARPQLRTRFYSQASIADAGNGIRPLLDGRPIKTPARNELALPTRALAEAVAAEWEAQRERVDPSTMPLTRLSNTIIDGVVSNADAVAAEIARYLRSDLLFYRAERPQELVDRQERLWNPVIDWASDALEARFVLSQGVLYTEQPDVALERTSAAIPRDPWRLGAVHAMTTLTGSALIALAVLARRLDTAQAWSIAHVDEDWNMEQWGQDGLALERRAFRFTEMRAAGQVLELL